MHFIAFIGTAFFYVAFVTDHLIVIILAYIYQNSVIIVGYIYTLQLRK